GRSVGDEERAEVAVCVGERRIEPHRLAVFALGPADVAAVALDEAERIVRGRKRRIESQGFADLALGLLEVAHVPVEVPQDEAELTVTRALLEKGREDLNGALGLPSRCRCMRELQAEPRGP